MNLRPATPADTAALAALGREAFVAAFGHLYSAADLASFLDASHSEEKVAKEIVDPGMAVMLAERDGKLIGMCKLVFDSTLKEHGTAAHPLELKQLYTAAGQTGGGIGAALMEWALGMARDRSADEVQLSVYSENHAAQRFYSRYGFESIAAIHFWVGDQCDDEFCFAKRL